jgi:hypothetical protein
LSKSSCVHKKELWHVATKVVICGGCELLNSRKSAMLENSHALLSHGRCPLEINDWFVMVWTIMIWKRGWSNNIEDKEASRYAFFVLKCEIRTRVQPWSTNTVKSASCSLIFDKLGSCVDRIAPKRIKQAKETQSSVPTVISSLL